jgi:hypothetical protein
VAVILMLHRAKREAAEDLLFCHAVRYGPAGKQVLRSLRSHQDYTFDEK